MITTMCSAETPGARDITKDWASSFTDPNRKLFVHDTYEGCVLEEYERNMHDDSDFYAIVWDEATQSVKSIEYGTTRAWTYPNHAKVDATPEVRAKADAYYIRTGAAGLRRNAEEEAKEPAKGKTCKVVKGRKIAKDTVVECVGAPTRSVYGFNSVTYNILVRLPNGDLIHTNVKNLEVLNPEKYHMSEAASIEQATAQVKHAGNCRSKNFVGISSRLLKFLR